ncbi:hypothetical protein AAF712_006890 [Marasmius tenuissimus]|uniref:Uncharacterized protein n=1 Tax=Marasmius tenuissimus TaxID=585030 RepID=A0ABR2ZWK3_9AGAR
MAERMTHDPSNDTCPNFTHDRYQTHRTLLIDSDQLPDITNDEQAADHLRDIWRSENEENRARWQEQLENDRVLENQRRQQEEEAEAAAEEETRKAREERRKEKEKRKETLHDFELGTPMAREVTERLHPHAKEKMEKREYTPFWYFTNEASSEAESLVKMTLEDSVFGFTKDSDGKLSLTSNPTARASPKAKADENLTWDEVLEGKSFFLKCLDSGDWPPKWKQMWSKFYVLMEMHPDLRGYNGKQIFARYHAKMRLHWYDENRAGRPFDVSVIDEKVLEKCRKAINNAEFESKITR